MPRLNDLEQSSIINKEDLLLALVNGQARMVKRETVTNDSYEDSVISMADYIAKGESVLTDNVMYYIPLGEPNSVLASQVAYDNSATELDATNVNSAITEVDGKVEEVKSSLLWKRVNAQAVSGSTPVAIPSDAKEVKILIDLNGLLVVNSDFVLDNVYDTSRIVLVGGAYAGSGSNAYANINLSKSSVSMRTIYKDGATVLNTSYMIVYYR